MYTVMPANEGQRSVLMIGWQIEAVFIGASHAELAQQVADLLNADKVEQGVKDEVKVPA